MTVEIRLSGGGAESAGLAADLLGLLSDQEPSMRRDDDGGGGGGGAAVARKDLATVLAVASIVIGIPGFYQAVVPLAKRRRIAAAAGRLLEAIRDGGGSAVLDIEGAPPADLTVLGTDAVVDLLLRDYGQR